MTFGNILEIIFWLLLIPGTIEYITTKRPKLVIEIVNAESRALKPFLEFYIENIGDIATKLDPEIKASCEYKDSSVEELSYYVKENDRVLPSYGKKNFWQNFKMLLLNFLA